jgi:hypothetical protein
MSRRIQDVLVSMQVGEEILIIVMYGRPPLGKGIFGVSASGSGAVMYPAFVRGA